MIKKAHERLSKHCANKLGLHDTAVLLPYRSQPAFFGPILLIGGDEQCHMRRLAWCLLSTGEATIFDKDSLCIRNA